MALFHTQQYQQAIEAFNKALALHENWQSYQGLGSALFHTQQYQQAIEAFNKSLSVEEDIQSYTGLIVSLIFSRKYNQGMKVLDEFLEHYPKERVKRILHISFCLLGIYQDICRNNESPAINKVPQMQRYFAESVLNYSIDDIYEVGKTYLFSHSTILNMIILHGGYFKLLESGRMSRSYLRHIDSLYQPTFPSLQYNTVNHDILAPWITLSAQEVLLDLDLGKFIVIEYGSGMSSFFFCKNTYKCFSYEDDMDPAGKGKWSEEMKRVSKIVSCELNLITPNPSNIKPKYVLNNLIADNDQKILINIDGGDRSKHFKDWVEFLSENKNLKVILMVDNSHLCKFDSSFKILKREGATVVHHYGNVYGQLVTNQCTSFCTFMPSLLTSKKTSSPHFHNQKWGVVNHRHNGRSQFSI